MMTEVAFHFNVPDKLAYCCRLLRKTARSNVRVAVVGAPELLRDLDRALWSFSAHDFVSHCMPGEAGCDATMLQASAVVLLGDAEAAPHHQVLLNLGGQVPAGFSRFERLIEVVSRDDADDRRGARERWRHYASRGYKMQQHDLERKAS